MYYNMKVNIQLLNLFSSILVSHALITGNIQIVGESLSSIGMQYLPGSYVNSFPRWTVNFNADQTSSTSSDASPPPLSLVPLDGTFPSDSPFCKNHEFVDPTSNQELWWPSDLKRLQVRPTLDFFIKSAVPSLVMAGIEVRVPPDVSMDGKEWRNFGKNSQPLASTWTSFQMAVENGFRVEAFYGRAMLENSKENKLDSRHQHVMDWKYVMDVDNTKDFCMTEEGEEIPSLVKEERYVQSVQGTQRAVELMGRLLANLEDESPLLEGMHIVSIPITEMWSNLPELVNEGDSYKLVSVGTVESDARELLKMEHDFIALSASSLLTVDVSKVVAGGQSDYIPDVYVPLYKN